MSACVLMIEDDREMVMLGKIILEKEGYTFISASDGREGLQLLAENAREIDLILLDIMLPEIYGWEILEKVKSNEKTKHIPVIMLSAKHPLEDEAESSHYATLYSAYVVKPFVVRELLDRIAAVLSGSPVDNPAN
jgi:DNA-binding response OmpR family regulator